MLIQIVTFNLDAMTDDEYRSASDGWAKVIAQTPGLVSKTWLADKAANTYGGVYSWRILRRSTRSLTARSSRHSLPIRTS